MRTYRLLLPVCLILLTARLALAETVTLDSMDANQSAWGAAAQPETALVREGQPSAGCRRRAPCAAMTWPWTW